MLIRDQREDRLPVWAQDSLQHLRNHIGYLETEARLKAQKATGVRLLDSHGEPCQHIGRRSLVEFDVTGGTVQAHIRQGGGRYGPRGLVEISGINSLSSVLSIQPGACNVVHIGFAKE
jgi:hypothetical protein